MEPVELPKVERPSQGKRENPRASAPANDDRPLPVPPPRPTPTHPETERQ